ncbi:MAG: Ig-like domain-containing protein, partial [Myxococcales bacterium]
MFRSRVPAVLGLLVLSVVAGCSRTSPRQPREPIVAIQLDPPQPVVPIGEERVVTAQGIKADGSTVALDDVEWSSSDESRVSLTPELGTVKLKGLGPGDVKLTATARGIGASIDVRVEGVVTRRLEISPPQGTVAIGGLLKLRAVAIMSDDSTVDVTSRAEWKVEDSTVAGVGNDASAGEVIGTRKGETTVVASFDGQSATAKVEVSGANLLRIDVTPPRATMPLKTQQRFTAIAVFSDATTSDVTEQVDWSSSDDKVVRFTGAAGRGVAEAMNAGTVRITARFGDHTGEAEATVTTEKLVAVEVAPARVQLAKGTSAQLQATGI